MYKIIWKPVKYINYIINNGFVLYPGGGPSAWCGATPAGVILTAFSDEVNLSLFVFGNSPRWREGIPMAIEHLS